MFQLLKSLFSINSEKKKNSESEVTVYHYRHIHKILAFMVCARVDGYVSSTSCFIAAVPRNKSNCVPGGSNPERGKTKGKLQTLYQDIKIL